VRVSERTEKGVLGGSVSEDRGFQEGKEKSKDQVTESRAAEKHLARQEKSKHKPKKFLDGDRSWAVGRGRK